MAGPQWAEARKALIDIANEAMRCDSEGISLRFLNSQIVADGIKVRLTKLSNVKLEAHLLIAQGQDALLRYFDSVKANGVCYLYWFSKVIARLCYVVSFIGGTPTGARLDAILGQYANELDNAIGTPEYSTIKPLDLICLTDGAPSQSINFVVFHNNQHAYSLFLYVADAPLPILEKWAAHLDAKKHHPNAVGVQFVQIGNSAGCTAALVALTKGKVRVSNSGTISRACVDFHQQNMVDTVSYDGLVTPERLTRILLGAIKPSARGNTTTGTLLP